MFGPHTVFFDLSLAANALGLWTMMSASGARRDFHSRAEALAFAVREVRQSRQRAQSAIRIEGADLKWRSFDCELKALADGTSSAGGDRRAG